VVSEELLVIDELLAVFVAEDIDCRSRTTKENPT